MSRSFRILEGLMSARSLTSKRGAEKPVRAAHAIKPHAEKAVELLKALANEQRLLILCNLLDGPMAVGELNEKVHLSQSALSQHLAVLRESNVVVTTREAQSIRYSLPEGAVTRIIRILYKQYCER